ncbi:3'-5' exonuclease DinG [Halomonadaceae bacterium LMG 33818]|uniref:ATP-dependent DNA helicase n=1 Tax=Cernens ardua TaxID=3402176 RepID=UPI003EDC7D5C
MGFRIAVRALCEFVAKEGDLDLRFTPSPTALEGIEGHALVASRRDDEYMSELPLKGEFDDLQISGRADGYDPRKKRLEEVKTHRGLLERQPANHRVLHWAQLKVYGFLACEHFGLENIELALIYFDVDRERETPLVEKYSRQSLEIFFNSLCKKFLMWARQEAAHVSKRTEALNILAFPKPAFRQGQRDLAESVYKAARLQRTLMLQAPTGLGKTLGTLFPLLKAMPDSRLDRIFFLTAKTTGRQLAIDALDMINQGLFAQEKIRGVELIARERSCEHPDLACHGESCPLARGFYDRVPQARKVAVRYVQLKGAVLDAATLRAIALKSDICPYYFGQEMARWADVSVGDYNHYFGLGGMLFALSRQLNWRVATLLDEAHNMVERGRLMFSAELSGYAIKQVAREAPKGFARSFQRLLKILRESVQVELGNGTPNSTSQHGKPEKAGLLPQMPSALISEMLSLTARIGERLADQPDQPLDSGLMSLYLEMLHFLRVHEIHDPRFFQYEVEYSRRDERYPVLRLKNNVPAPYLAPRFEATHTSVLFSATLITGEYYRLLLGLPTDTVWKEIDSPFKSSQLKVHLVRNISTRYRDRHSSIQPIATLIQYAFEQQQGNYLAFFSSFDYLQQVAEYLETAAPTIPVWKQHRYMDETARRDFINRFEQDGVGIGFAVLGGVFGEGIDLPGNRLVGAFVATLGLPQFNPFNQALKEQLTSLFGANASEDRGWNAGQVSGAGDMGYRFAYLYPGMTKVIQAAGRVIRSEQDIGQLWLIDDRFAESNIRALLPVWWQLSS